MNSMFELAAPGPLVEGVATAIEVLGASVGCTVWKWVGEVVGMRVGEVVGAPEARMADTELTVSAMPSFVERAAENELPPSEEDT